MAVGDTKGVDFTEPGFTLQTTFKYTGDGPIYSKGGSQYSLGVWGGQLSFWTEGGGNWPGIDAGNLVQGQWYTTTLVVAANEIRLYVDAEEIGSTPHDFASLPTTDSPLHLGYDAGNDDSGSPTVDSFRAFETALTTDQITSGFAEIPDDAVAWLPLNEATNGVAPDESGQGNDGILQNGPSFVPSPDGQGIDLAEDGYVIVENDDSLAFDSTGFTLHARLKYDGGSGLVLDRGSSAIGSGTEQFGLGIYDGTLSFYMQTADGTYPETLQTDVESGTWHSVTIVGNQGENQLYVDGDPIGTIEHEATGPAESDGPLIVGGGDLDVAVTSTWALPSALSAEQVSTGFRTVPDTAVLWFDYATIEDRSVEWRNETVPGQWGYDGYEVPEDSADWYPPGNQRGWYRREIDVPEDWREGRVLLQFGAVYSEAWVYVNGSLVGTHVGGHTPFEVDVTDEIEPQGSNTVTVGVAQVSEADDMGWQNVTGGIPRDVTLISVPQVHLADCDVRTDLTDNGTAATVHVNTIVENSGKSETTAELSVSLTDPNGTVVGSDKAVLDAIPPGEARSITVEMTVDDPETWNPEQPRLHDLDVSLDAGGVTEEVTERIGIREIEVDGQALRINGKSVTLRGVNWEEIHLPKHGHAIPAEITREDARRLKEANINYVRAAHHPTSEAFLDACDELGLVVEVEAPHMFIGRQRGDPYPDVVIEQTLEMVERDKNRASVCLWSIANESEWYEAFETVTALVKEADPTRPLIFNHDAYDESDPWHESYSLRAHHYPALRTDSTVTAYGDLDAPTLFDEYAHTYCYNDQELVTDPGLRDEWGSVFELIWERCRDAEAVAGAAIWAGGDHLEQWGEYLWGLLDRNRRARPEYWHVKKAYSPVQVVDTTWRGNGNVVTLTVENRHEFIDLTERAVSFEGARGRGNRELSAQPGEQEQITVPVEDGRIEMTVTHPEGHVIQQVVFTADTPSTRLDSTPITESISATDETLSVETDTFSLSVDRGTGNVVIEGTDGNPIVSAGPELVITPTQNATGRAYENAIDHRLSERTVTDVRRVDGESAIAVDVTYDIAEGTFVIYPQERGIDLSYDFSIQEAIDAREVGVAMPLNRDYTTLSWTRDGQWTAYPETHIGRETGSAQAFPDGSRPNHEGIRIRSDQPWKDDATSHGSNDFRGTKRNVYRAALTNESDRGFRVLGNGETHVRAQVRDETVDLLAIDRSLSGTNADEWLSRHQPVNQDPTIGADESIDGRVVFRVANPEEDGDDSNKGRDKRPGNGNGRGKGNGRGNRNGN
ncbi:glycoside hydrolase family 2 TIM barrel-domain containing protein [Halorubrum sp. AS12]|uniref:glycoside hydrolase family 2 TIM barrel-domain containing protein n=1 Tax=Halorubrum sp. AS12 TaxID=3409687 RepID=UPI003DA73160